MYKRQEYSNLTWFGLLFGCGMGVGLVFWGVAEPLTHYLNPVGVESATPEAADFAMKSFFMHWGILPWANYAVIGLALAYFMFRKNKKGLVSSIPVSYTHLDVYKRQVCILAACRQRSGSV